MKFFPLKSDIINEPESNQKLKKMYTDLLTFSETPDINSEIYDKILNLNSQEYKMQKNKKSSIFSKNGYIGNCFHEYMSDCDITLSKVRDKNIENDKEEKKKEKEKYVEKEKEEEEDEEEEDEQEEEEENEQEEEDEQYEKEEEIYDNEIEEKSYHDKIKNGQYDNYCIGIYEEKGHKDAYECEKEKINIDKKSKVKKEKSINNSCWKDIISKNNTILNKSNNNFKNIDEENVIIDIILDIYKNTMEHKKTHFLCLEEILKKINLILKKQVEICKSNVYQKSERQLLFQNIYELKKQIADKAFNSLANKDFARCYIKNIHSENIKDNIDKNTERNILNFKNLEKINEKSDKYYKDIYEKFKTKSENVNLFLFHLNELEKSIYAFTHFCRNVSSLTYPDGMIGLNSLEQK
ncbi:conserved Plasmodium protein, unknown function, partial [Plasmodium gallinaceum]